MSKELIIYTACSSFSILVSFFTAIMFWKRRSIPGIIFMSLAMFMASFWSFTDLLSFLNENPFSKIIWNRIAYSGAVFIPVDWFLFSLQYPKQNTRLNKKLLILFIMPVISLSVLFTNDFHHLFMTKLTFLKLGSSNNAIVYPTYGIWFWIHAIYSYGLLLIGNLLLLRSFINLGKIYRRQAIILICAVLFPLGDSLLHSLKISLAGPVDTTVFSFSVSGILMFLGLFKFKLFDIIPIARETVIESIQDVIIMMDNYRRIIDINKAAEKFLGTEQSSVLELDILAILNGDLIPLQKYSDVLEIKEEVTIGKGKIRKQYEIKISPLYNHKKVIVGRSIILHDITSLKNMTDELDRSRTIAENTSDAKSKFLATMSHEIRTPLNGIIGMAELLRGANLTTEEKRFLSAIKYSANSLLDIINDILDFSKIEAGKMELDYTNFNVRELVENTINMFYYSNSNMNVSLSLKIQDEVPESIVGDPVRVRQILMNLIGNSLKFTRRGFVKIKLEMVKCSAESVLLNFSVTDSGIGISEKKIQNLFHSFHQLDSSTTRKYGGTGLGLAIVKRLVELMNGTINVESKLNHGSTFSVLLPFKIHNSSEPERNTDSLISKNISTKKLSILLAEDNRVNQLFMIKLLEKQNYEVDTAENGKIVLEKMKVKRYDLILMDIQMPDMDGYETTIYIRNAESNDKLHIPIIALTANATTGDREKCLAVGMDDYLPKPVNPEKLYSCINKYS